MPRDIHFELTHEMVENIETYSQLLKKEPNTILKEALELYFETQQKRLFEKNMNDENAMTNLDYDEFWDGIDL
ncbi:MAG: hypothetical protein IE916_05145 [Epsilonproteobacteria bacterium]|nr:hypothetical protein [Campylobacterota bacterium]